jgi:sigma-B regulation protein RsbU (phosphoserine phosphatase)
MRTRALNVLLVEDNAGDARLLREMFTTERPGSIELTHLMRMSEALVHLAKGGVDIVLLDMGLPDGHGLDTVRRARAVAPDVPLIVLTGLDDEALAAEAMKEGAQDYLIKGQIENRALPRALRHAIERHRMQAEADHIRMEQLQFKDEFLSHVSHELRSPLTAIYQFVTILQDGLAGEVNQEQQQHLEIVLRNVKQLRAMINDLLEVTSVQAGKLLIRLERTSIFDAITYTVDTLQEAARDKGITLTAGTGGVLPDIWADATRIRQILIILVDNALKFTPTNGTVKVQTRRWESDPSFLVLEVADSGCGISADKTELIFERLFQVADPAVAARKGLGLGLYICKELVTRQGGRIWASSVPGEGSTFSITLPVFSLSRLMAPAFVGHKYSESQITLVLTEVGSRMGWLSEKVRADSSNWMRDVLQRCLNSKLDVLLPDMGSSGATELFVVAAVTDEIGGEAITKRIREKLQGSEEIRQADLTFSTCYWTLPPIQRNADESMESFVEKVAAKIQESIDERSSSSMVKT